MQLYLRNNETGEIATFGSASATGVFVFTLDQLNIFRSVVSTHNAFYGTSFQVPPPSSVNNYVNVDASAWATMMSVAHGS